jgi:hypothetical protein
MTIKSIIARLNKIKEKHGEDTEVYFDCPKCKESFAPDEVITKAVHMGGKSNDKRPISN